MRDYEGQNETIKEVTAKTIRKYRKKNGLTQKQLAAAIGRTESIIRKYENGSVYPPYDTLKKIAEVLQVDPLVFMCGDEISAMLLNENFKRLSNPPLPEKFYNLHCMLKPYGLEIHPNVDKFMLVPYEKISGLKIQPHAVYVTEEELDEIIYNESQFVLFQMVQLYNSKSQ